MLFALLTRALPFGEGPGGREGGRRTWLGRIAEGAWAWPLPPAPLLQEGEELMGTQMATSLPARRVVSALLTRERGRRATMAGVAADPWLAGAHSEVGVEGEIRGEFGAVAWAEVE